jgi:type VI secretion system protein ImpA
MANIQDLLTETPAEPPCGPDLTYDNDFQAMESAAQGKAEQQFGETVIPAEPPDWRDVERQASALMLRTKDLRVAVLLCRAWTILHGPCPRMATTTSCA